MAEGTGFLECALTCGKYTPGAMAVGDLLRRMPVPHTSRLFDPDNAAPVFEPVIREIRALPEGVAPLRPDAITSVSGNAVVARSPD